MGETSHDRTDVAIQEAADRYQRAKAIACAALEQPPEVRGDLISAECGDDANLHREVVWLVAAAEDATSDDVPARVREAARQAAASVRVDAPLPRNYRVLKKLGEGGMGAVYLAERIDGDLGQRVALKLLHTSGAPDAKLTQRFAAERRILAALSHPNIAHLIDAGITGEGRPFLAMEYVDGERIDTWCDARGLPLRARIELFRKVCAAVEHAHRHLVIHRDIKPANILVTADGEPKLLDFGIARLLGEDSTNPRTETDHRALTLAYASPEQIEGELLSTATDVYSLGIVLYQLLTGVRPFDHLESAHRLSNAIISGEITPPSRQIRRRASESPAASTQDNANVSAVKTANLSYRTHAVPSMRRLPTDIDAIVLKALRREPAQRYASAADLMADLSRFLASRPVMARRGQWHYRARRFAWRWRYALAIATAFAALLIGFMLDREAHLARVALERDRARSLVGFMNNLFENADSLRSRGNQVTVREMLDRGARELQARHDLDPAQRSSMLFAMGRAYNALGQGSEALPLLKSAQALLTDGAGGIEERAAVLAELAGAYSTSRDTAASVAADAEAIRLLRTADGDHTDEILRLRIRELHNHVNLLDIPLAESQTQLHEIRTLLEARPKSPDAMLMRVYSALATAYSDQNPSQSAQMAKKAIEIAMRLYGPDDPRILSSRFAEATAMRSLDPERAIVLYESLIADYERLVGHGTAMATLLVNLGVTLAESRRIDQAIAAYERAADMALKTEGSAQPIYHLAISNLATAYSRNGNAEKAQVLMEGILPDLAAQAASITGSDQLIVYAAALDTLAGILGQQGKAVDAERTYVKAEQLLESIDADAYPEIRAEILEGLITSRTTLGRDAEAREASNRLEALQRRHGLSRDDAGNWRATGMHSEPPAGTDKPSATQ
jgi:serine/threonine-protein kinase